MIIGDINNINRSTSFFEKMIVDGHLYVDKTRMIEHFLTVPDSVQLIARQRRLGADLRDNKRLVKTGIAFYKKLCKVKCG